MHIGGTLTRLGSVTQPLHLAEILAATEEHPYPLEGVR
jgi:L-lactate dehydrogenase complex protein LldE